MMARLLRHLPVNESRIPHLSLGKFPTPVERFTDLGTQIGINELYVKRDDSSGKLYGGNKVRKLEYLLADAQQRGSDSVWTGGGIGSNHVLATSIYAREVSIQPKVVQFPQPVTNHVRQNLQALSTTQPETKLVSGEFTAFIEALKIKAKRHRPSASFSYIPPGGTSPLGELGYVNAVFELRQQIEAGEVPEPDVIFVPVGTGGTIAGLLLGCRLASLNTDVVGVRVADKIFGNSWRVARLANQAASLLSSYGLQNVPHISRNDVEIFDGYIGEGYGAPTELGQKAENMTAQHDLYLDPTYTSKTVAAIANLRDRLRLKEKTVLYWHTLNSVDLSNRIENANVGRDLSTEYLQFMK